MSSKIQDGSFLIIDMVAMKIEFRPLTPINRLHQPKVPM